MLITSSLICGTLSVVVIGANWFGVLSAWRNQRHYSPVPFAGGLLGCAACLLAPLPLLKCFAWAPLLADYSIPGFLYAAFVLGEFRGRQR